MPKYQNLEHTADLKIRSFGKTKEQVFVNMAIGMFANIGDEKKFLKDKPVSREIKIKANDLQSLLVDFLSELISLSDINNEIYTDYDLKIKENKLIAQVNGCKINGLKLEIKAVTYNDLKIKEGNNGWQAEVVFDI